MKPVLFLAASLLALAPAQAQGARLGLQLTLSKPQGDLDKALDGRLGYGGGLHLFLPVSGPHALVPRLDYTTWSRDLEYGNEVIATVKFADLRLGADYNYFVTGKANEGFYFLAGLSYSSLKLSADVTFYGLGSGSTSETSGRLSFDAGVGYQFSRHFGLEARFTTANHSYYGETMSAQSLNLSGMLRF